VGVVGMDSATSAVAVIPREAKRSRGIQFGLCFHRAVPVNKPHRGGLRKPRATPWEERRFHGTSPERAIQRTRTAFVGDVWSAPSAL
jgi:hypothetical protein